jgi:membrane dipeptidase
MEIKLSKLDEERALKMHNESLIVDMHSDVNLDVIRSRGQGETRVLERRHLPRWREGSVDIVVLNATAKFGAETYPFYVTPVHNFLMMVDAIQEEIAESSTEFLLVLEPDDIAKAKREGKIGIVLGMEGAEPVERSIGLLRCYYRLGLRIMNLTWHLRNLTADGTAETSNSGLSNFGKTLVKEINRLGILIDVSHLSPAGVRDVLELSEYPIIASHSNAYSLCKHQRSLEDWQIKGIAQKGGIIGIAFLGNFVAKENPNIAHVLDHIDHIVKLAGTTHIGMGPDYTDFCQDMFISSRRSTKSDLPIEATEIPYAEGVENTTKLINFTRGLVSRGYKDEEIKGILGENFVRVFEKVHKSLS